MFSATVVDLEFKEDKLFYANKKIKINQTDKKGHSAVHYLINSSEHVSYDNVRILMLLVKAGANIKMKDKKGNTALTLALQYGVVELSKALQKLDKVPVKKWVSCEF